jgi:hypothetical protein
VRGRLRSGLQALELWRIDPGAAGDRSRGPPLPTAHAEPTLYASPPATPTPLSLSPSVTPQVLPPGRVFADNRFWGRLGEPLLALGGPTALHGTKPAAASRPS